LIISFALVAHGDPSVVERLVRVLTSQAHSVAIHYDLKSPLASYEYLLSRFQGNDRVRFARRIRVGWGEWSVVQATLNCLDQIKEAGWEPDYVYLVSGLDYPIRPRSQLEAFLNRNKGDEFIESVPSDTLQWVKTGPQKERYRYRWHFNWRSQPRRTELSLKIQKFMRLERRFVRGLTPFMGSQWWVLTWPTLQKIMNLAREPDILRFFKTTLIPDELFFQTLARHVVPSERIVNCALTLYQFSDYGYPVVYYNDHLDYLQRQPFFMARKMSPRDAVLRDALDESWTGVRKSPHQFIDNDVGIVSPEYEDWRLAYRNGPPGLPVAGRSNGRWHDDQKRITIPFFAIIGSSTAELRVVHKAISWHPDLVCHGQLFHPNFIEFADRLTSFAGYDTDSVSRRLVSAPNFLADVVRAQKGRVSGFLLRWGQGWHIPELMADRPNVRLAILRGEPLLSFVENIMGTEPHLDEPFDFDRLKAIPSEVMANRFRRFLNDYERYMGFLDKLESKANENKPKGWVARPNLIAKVSDWVSRLESCLGVSLSNAPQGAAKADLQNEMDALGERRQRVAEELMRGGIDRAVIDTLRRQPDKPAAALSLL
jgi:Core-2/I-Branching enzyme